VLNNFGQSEESQVKLMRITFQHMFPTINTKIVKLSDCRRVVLYHYHKDEGTVEMRHYAIKAQPVGVSSAVKKILQSRIPNLGELEVRKLALLLFFRAYLIQFIASKYREVLRDCYL
jgi:ribosome biogenesis protein SSF1/2